MTAPLFCAVLSLVSLYVCIRPHISYVCVRGFCSAGRLECALSTMVVIFVLSTLLTGVAFYLLGLMQLGKSKHIPSPHIIYIASLRQTEYIQPSPHKSDVSEHMIESSSPPCITCLPIHTYPTLSLTPPSPPSPPLVSSFVPRHVLLGCIGGMGMFIATQGIGISTNLPWSFAPQAMLSQFAPWDTLAKSGTTMLLTLTLSLVRVAFR